MCIHQTLIATSLWSNESAPVTKKSIPIFLWISKLCQLNTKQPKLSPGLEIATKFFPLRLKYLEKTCCHLRSFETKGLAVATLLLLLLK